MKVFKIILIALVVLIVLIIGGICIYGFSNPSVKYGYEIIVDKPIEEAWAVYQDESKFHLWLDGFQSIELIEGEEGEPGSKYKVIVNPGEGQEDFEMIETFVGAEEFEYVELDFTSEMMDFAQTTYFSQTPEGVSIRTESEVFPKGVMMQAMFSIMEKNGGAFTKQEGNNFEALKTVIEENTTDYYPAPELLDSIEIEEENEVIGE